MFTMYHWPLRKKSGFSKPAYLILDERGIGLLSVRSPQLPQALDMIEAGRLPVGAELIPNHQLLRVRSCRESSTIVARMHGNVSRRFRLRNVVDRDQLFEALRDHPAVSHARVDSGQHDDHLKRKLALGGLAATLAWVAIETIVAGGAARGATGELSVLGLFTFRLPLVVYLIGLVAVMALGVSWWWPREELEFDEVLFA